MINMEKTRASRLNKATKSEIRWYNRYYQLRDFKSNGGCCEWPLYGILAYDRMIMRAARRLKDATNNLYAVRKEPPVYL